MQERHIDRKLYFNEQSITTEKYVIPYIREIRNIDTNSVILEVGCGEGGNLEPFLKMGCKVYGIDILDHQIQIARRIFEDHPMNHNLNLIAEDIYKIKPEALPSFDVIFLRDVIEHIPDQQKFMHFIKSFLKEDGVIFFGFPPWRMPFGGHQQVCQHKLLSKLPYFHLLPQFLYSGVLKLFGESQALIDGLAEVKETGISIQEFFRYLKKSGFEIVRENHFLINPNYEIKFNLKPRLLPSIFKIPWLCDFYTTAIYCVAKKKL
ncbi:MAG TPA: class I SAM-dependent methyltransferase [Saprospiraceae bacterium]|nr:class I SAM-dependent methyltransferase [Saprospiraceae bacterium]